MTVGKAISMLRSSIVNARIYPKGSQMVESSIKGAFQALESCLAESSPIVISDLQGKLCLNGKELVEAKDFRPFLTQNDVQSLRFLKGLTQEEVGHLMDGLGRKKEPGTTDLSVFLKSKNVTHVEAEKIEFVELKKGDVVVQQVMTLIEQSMSDTPTLMNSIEESFRMIDQIPEETTRKDAQKKIAAQLATLPPSNLRDLFESPWPERAEKSGLRNQIVQSLSREKLEETLEEVNKWYQQIQSDSKSELEVVEKLNGLKSFLGKVLNSPMSKQVPFALYEELLNVKLIDEVPAGVQKGENAGLLVEVEQLLHQPSESLLEPTVRQRLPELLKALCAMGKDEPLQKLTDKMLDNLHNPAPVARETAVKTCRVFQDILSSNRKEKPFLQIVSAFHTMAESESAPAVYSIVADAVQAGALELLVAWRFDESAALLATLRRHSREESPIGQKKKLAAAQSLQDFAVRGLETICADLNAPMKDRQNGSYKVLAELGEGAVGPLVEAVKRSLDPRSRQAAIQALRRLGATVKDTLLQQMNIGMPADAMTKLLPILQDYADVSMLPMLSTLLRHPDGGVRRQIAQLLTRIKDPKAQPLLVQLLDDAEPDVQTEALRLIGELKLKNLSGEISRRMVNATPMVQEEMCITLGNLAERSAAPELVKLVMTTKSFFNKVREAPDTVRARAIWALGQLLPNEDAQKALEKMAHSSNPLLQRAAQSALIRPTMAAALKQAA